MKQATKLRKQDKELYAYEIEQQNLKVPVADRILKRIE